MQQLLAFRKYKLCSLWSEVCKYWHKPFVDHRPKIWWRIGFKTYVKEALHLAVSQLHTHAHPHARTHAHTHTHIVSSNATYCTLKWDVLTMHLLHGNVNHMTSFYTQIEWKILYGAFQLCPILLHNKLYCLKQNAGSSCFNPRLHSWKMSHKLNTKFPFKTIYFLGG
jgi:hypothetical protein